LAGAETLSPRAGTEDQGPGNRDQGIGPLKSLPKWLRYIG
jgi:hypothetical protein